MSLMDKMIVVIAAHITEEILFLHFRLSICNCVPKFTLNTTVDQSINFRER